MEIKKITKKEVREFIKDLKIEHQFGWRLWQVGAYIYENKLETYIAYHGQGLDEIVYNDLYSDIVIFTKDIQAWKNGEFNLNETVDNIYEKINDMIKDFNLN